jgi:hypothetical protein
MTAMERDAASPKLAPDAATHQANLNGRNRGIADAQEIMTVG